MYCAVVAQDDWSGRLVRTIATEIRRHRKRCGLSAQDLADECAELGYPIARQVITNLEIGRRDTVTVAELIVLGNALGVPPSLLVFPVGFEATSEPLPGRHRPTWHAFSWFAADEPYPDLEEPDHHSPSSGGEFDAWMEGAVGAYMYRLEDESIRNCGRIAHDIGVLGAQMAGAVDSATRTAYIEVVKARENELRQTERALIAHRQQIAADGLLVRPLPSFLAHLENESPDQPRATTKSDTPA